MKQNPFSLLFGKEPLQHISRLPDITSIIETFCDDPPSQQVYMISGIRGSGKTVLMTEVSRKIKRAGNWIIIDLNPERDLLRDLAEKLNSDHMLAEIFRKAKINLSFLGIGLDISGTPPVTNIEVALERMLEHIKKKNRRVMITVDEVSNTPSMREFVHSFQIFIRKDLPVFLLMTGLYDNINTLQNEKSLTFLYRASKLELKPLSLRSISDHYASVFDLEPEAALEMAQMTKGYSFAFQVLGYLTWESEGDYKKVQSEYLNYLADYSYDKIWSELSREDRRILYGIASTDSGKIVEIRQFLNLDTNHFNPYRKRLIKKGLINGEEYGYVRFVLPYFGSYVLDNYLSP